jgi:cytochrome c
MKPVLLLLLLLLPVSTAFADVTDGDAERGRLAFHSCRTCHYPEQGIGHNNGPALWNILGTTAGTQPGFDNYSETMRQSGVVWNQAYLDAWLADPEAFMPGTTMMALPVRDAGKRADIIAYLKTFAPASEP